MGKGTRTNIFLIKLSFFGICSFVLLYIIAAYFYPGGSQADKSAKTFSLLNNYWCDLLSEQAKNGKNNTARPIAIISWFILCAALAVFWYFLPYLFSPNRTWKKIVQVCGIAAMLISAFLFTSLHDVVIHAGGVLGFIAFLGAFRGFYENRMQGLCWTGIFCVALMGLNYYIMVADDLSIYLPAVQKITFIVVLLWVLFINRKLYLQMIRPSY